MTDESSWLTMTEAESAAIEAVVNWARALALGGHGEAETLLVAAWREAEAQRAAREEAVAELNELREWATGKKGVEDYLALRYEHGQLQSQARGLAEAEKRADAAVAIAREAVEDHTIVFGLARNTRRSAHDVLSKRDVLRAKLAALTGEG